MAHRVNLTFSREHEHAACAYSLFPNMWVEAEQNSNRCYWMCDLSVSMYYTSRSGMVYGTCSSWKNRFVNGRAFQCNRTNELVHIFYLVSIKVFTRNIKMHILISPEIVYTPTLTHPHTHTNTHSYTNTHKHPCSYIHQHTCMPIYTYMYKHINLHTHTWTSMHTQTSVYTHTWTHVYAYTNMHKHEHAYTHTQSHTVPS